MVDASQLPSRIGPDGGQDWGWGLPPSTDPRFIGPPGHDNSFRYYMCSSRPDAAGREAAMRSVAAVRHWTEDSIITPGGWSERIARRIWHMVTDQRLHDVQVSDGQIARTLDGPCRGDEASLHELRERSR